MILSSLIVFFFSSLVIFRSLFFEEDGTMEERGFGMEEEDEIDADSDWRHWEKMMGDEWRSKRG